eukprot:6174699-Pleurochrysis_carterae.AAC.3
MQEGIRVGKHLREMIPFGMVLLSKGTMVPVLDGHALRLPVRLTWMLTSVSATLSLHSEYFECPVASVCLMKGKSSV